MIPRTYPNVGTYFPVSGVLDGAASITTQYEGSVTDTFDFESFYFGCVVMTLEAVCFPPILLSPSVSLSRRGIIANLFECDRSHLSHSPATSR